MRQTNLLLLLSLLFLCSGIESVAQNLPPGSQYLGKSINLLKGDKELGSKMLLETLSATQIESSRPGAGSLTVFTESTTTVAEATQKYAVKLGLDANYGAFSASANMSFSKEEKEKSQTQLVLTTKELQTAEVSLKGMTVPLDAVFEKDLNNPAISPKDLFKNYGTHIALGIKVGGRFSIFFSTYENEKASKEVLELSAKASYGGITGSADYSKELTSTTKTVKLKSEIRITGGEPDKQTALEKNQDKDSYTAWASSTAQNPGVFAYTNLVPFWELQGVSDQRKKELKFGFEYLFTIKSLQETQKFYRKGYEEKMSDIQTLVVPKNYKILCGGADAGHNSKVFTAGYVETRDYPQAQRNYLTSSFPENTSTWTAAQKAHWFPSKSTLDIYAIAVFDPFDMLDVKIEKNTSTKVGEYHKIRCGMNSLEGSGYTIVGGGAKIDYTGQGALLIGSYPEMVNGKLNWTAHSRDHIERDDYGLTSYAIFLKFKDPRVPFSLESELFSAESLNDRWNKKISNVAGPNINLVGGGAYTYTNPAQDFPGSFLLSSFPGDGEAWVAVSKDEPGPKDAYGLLANLKVIAIGLKIVEKKK